MGRDTGALSGLSVLVTRPAGHGERLARTLERFGASVELRPTIAIEPPADPAPAERAVRSIGRYTWIVFTSANGVRSFFATAARVGRPALSIDASVAVVGPATARAAESHGATVRLVATDARADGLGAMLASRLVAQDRVLVVAPEARRDELVEQLRATGAAVDAHAFYRNVPAPGTTELAREVHGGRYDLAVFTSPSTLRRLVDAGAQAGLDLLPPLRGMGLVAIGPVTARALEELGLPVGAVALRPTDRGVAAAVARAAAQRVLASPPRPPRPRRSRR